MKFRLYFLAFICSLFLHQITFAETDFSKVQADWLTWTNNERSLHWAEPLVINEKLNSTALDWSAYSKQKWSIDHKRPGQKSYYDYKRIWSWFNSKWVQFKKVKTVTFSESIWWNVYFCKTDDCTQNISDAVYKTFAMYMKEKWKKYAPHYNSLVNKQFKQVWIWVVLDEAKHRYYLTVHYWTELILK
jgi:hypothetical protein